VTIGSLHEVAASSLFSTLASRLRFAGRGSLRRQHASRAIIPVFPHFEPLGRRTV
jgi:hypothetical protein